MGTNVLITRRKIILSTSALLLNDRANAFFPHGTGRQGGQLAVNYSIFHLAGVTPPAGFDQAIQGAIATVKANIGLIVPASVNMRFGWGTADGFTPFTGLAQSSWDFFTTETYSALRSKLISNALTANAIAAANSLPVSDPTGGLTLWIHNPHAVALGLTTATNSNVVYVGDDAHWPWSYNGTADGSHIDLQKILVHEMTEGCGRARYKGTPGTYYPYDLMAWSSAGVRATFNALGGYFSVNSGTTNKRSFNSSDAAGDYGDWDNSIPDCCNEANGFGTLLYTQNDIDAIDSVGWQTV